jgi:hypothetical protein
MGLFTDWLNGPDDTSLNGIKKRLSEDRKDFVSLQQRQDDVKALIDQQRAERTAAAIEKAQKEIVPPEKTATGREKKGYKFRMSDVAPRQREKAQQKIDQAEVDAFEQPLDTPTPMRGSVSQRRQNVVRPPRQPAGDTGRVDRPLDLAGSGGQPPIGGGGTGGSNGSGGFFDGNFVSTGAANEQRENLSLYLMYQALEKGNRITGNPRDLLQAMQRQYPDLNEESLKSAIQQVGSMDQWLAEKKIDPHGYKFEKLGGGQNPNIPEESLSSNYTKIRQLIDDNQNTASGPRTEIFGGHNHNLYDPTDIALVKGEQESDIFNDYRKILDRDNYRRELMADGRSEEDIQNLLGDYTDDDLADPTKLFELVGNLHRHHLTDGSSIPVSLKETKGRGASAQVVNEDITEDSKTELLNLIGPMTLGMNLRAGQFPKNNIEFNYAMKTLADVVGGDQKVMRDLLGFQYRHHSRGNPNQAKRKEAVMEPSELTGQITRHGNLQAMAGRPGKPSIDWFTNQMSQMAGVPEGQNETYMMPYSYGTKPFSDEAPARPNAGTIRGVKSRLEKQARGERLTPAERRYLEANQQTVEDWEEANDEFETRKAEYEENPDTDYDNLRDFSNFNDEQKGYWANIMEEIADYHNHPNNLFNDAEGNQHRRFSTDLTDGIQIGTNRYSPGQFRNFIDQLAKIDQQAGLPNFDESSLKELFGENIGRGNARGLRGKIRSALMRLRLAHNYMGAHKAADGSFEKAIGDMSMRSMKKSTGRDLPIFPFLKLSEKANFDPKEFGIEHKKTSGIPLFEFLSL